jgi:undecaprenyl-diphosphatase
MLRYLIELDKELFIFLNGFHSPLLDPVMLFVSEKAVWLPLYLYLAYLIFKDHNRDGWFVLIGVTLTIVLADQIASSFMKPYFARLRPSHDPSLQSAIHLVEGYRSAGKFGFASSHASNTFGVATFLFLLFKQTRRWIILLFFWAAFVTYSRVYLGVHYPGDILVGALVGVASAFAGFKFFQWLKKVSDQRKKISPDTE